MYVLLGTFKKALIIEYLYGCLPLRSDVERGAGLVSGQRQADAQLQSPDDGRRNPRHSFRNP